MRRLQKLPTPAAITLIALLSALLLAACGSSTSNTTSTGASVSSTQNASQQTQDTNGGEVVAQVGATPITKADINHWMLALGASLFYRDADSVPIPEGLLSDPPDYPRCIASLEVAATKAVKDYHESSVELLAKCRELNSSFKTYAVKYLIGLYQGIEVAEGFGAKATPAQIQTVFRQTIGHEYPTAADLRKYLTVQHRVLADVLLETKLTALAKQVLQRAHGAQAASRYNSLQAKAVAGTTCSPGFVVIGCKEFKKGEGSYTSTSPAILMERLAVSA